MQEYITVSQLNSYIKQIFDNEELLHNIPLLGEVYGVSFSRNVIYFSLKDENASIPCVCFYPAFSQTIQEGAKIVCYGSPNFYHKAGKLNFNVNSAQPLGQGKLYEEFLKLKETLEKEGLFDQEHKKPIPKNIQRVGVITSKEGAVIQDIKNVAWRRNPFLDIVLFSTKVQGVGAEKEIAKAIDLMGNYDKIDAIIVARGGGSLEDLAAYNTEIVARAAYNCPKPIISAVGHETDFTIIDFVSDLRAPTPSAAAELITMDVEKQKSIFSSLRQKFGNLLVNYVDERKNFLYNMIVKSSNHIEKEFLKSKAVYLEKVKAVKTLSNTFLNTKLYEMGLKETTLSKINPSQILQKGYAKIEQNGKSVATKQQLDYKHNFSIFFQDGKVDAKTVEGE